MNRFIPSFLKSGPKAAAKDDVPHSDMTEIPILEAEYKEYASRDEPVSEKETQMIADIRANKQVLLENLPEEIVNNGINTKFDAAGWIEEDWNLLKFIRARKHVMDDVMKAIHMSQIVFSLIPSPKISKSFLDVLQSHYPETLGRGIIINAPSIFFYTYKLISPFIDPVTKSKIFFSSITPNKNKQSTKLNGNSSASALSTIPPATETAAPQVPAIPELSASDIAGLEISAKESAELESEIKVDEKLSSDNKADVETPVTSDANNRPTTAKDSSEEPVNVSSVSDLSAHFKASILESSLGGDFFFRYNHDVYFPLAVKKYQQ
ncbi:CRAL-TRIO domain-containing protein [Smittium culicis]|uniref:CRAL-TRIO domain-containing protein n=1 Tax=Smittium culicis TaxID=133412 RepID=A0A1R1YFG0_9FUNG|nr:CRAL-TRIO domain-containing protein [Smittium culicis]